MPVRASSTFSLSAVRPEALMLGVRIRGTLGEKDPLNKVLFNRATSRVQKVLPRKCRRLNGLNRVWVLYYDFEETQRHVNGSFRKSFGE